MDRILIKKIDLLIIKIDVLKRDMNMIDRGINDKIEKLHKKISNIGTLITNQLIDVKNKTSNYDDPEISAQLKMLGVSEINE